MPTIEDMIKEVLSAVFQQGRVPNKRARSLVVTKLQEAQMWCGRMYEEIAVGQNFSTTNIDLLRLIEKFNGNNALQIEIAENELGYKVLTVGVEQQEPMDINEAYYFVRGLKHIKEMPCG